MSMSSGDNPKAAPHVLYNGALKIVQQTAMAEKTKLWSTTFAVTQNAVGIFQHDSLCLKKKAQKAVEPVLQHADMWNTQDCVLGDIRFIVYRVFYH